MFEFLATWPLAEIVEWVAIIGSQLLFLGFLVNVALENEKVC